jgi:hypothetical protein
MAVASAALTFGVTSPATTSAADSATTCTNITLSLGGRLVALSVFAEGVPCDEADSLLVLDYQDGLDAGELKLLMTDWTCAADQYACFGSGATVQQASGTPLSGTPPGPATGSTHGIVRIKHPTAALPHLLWLASKAARFLPPAVFRANVSGPYNGRRCLPLVGHATLVCSTTRILVARQDDIEWAYGSLWDKRTGYTDAGQLWVRRIGGTWKDVLGAVSDTGVEAPQAITDAWHLRNN